MAFYLSCNDNINKMYDQQCQIHFDLFFLLHTQTQAYGIMLVYPPVQIYSPPAGY
jgi:hypothetical protein